MKIKFGYLSLLLGLFCLTQFGNASASPITVTATPGNTFILSGRKHTIPIRINLNGLALSESSARSPINVAIVLDRSGSMGGEKIVRAREAALAAIGLLRPDDIVSVVTYDDVIDVVVPATKAADKARIMESISAIEARGSTALFAGVSKGSEEVQKFLEKGRVNRVILLSDGLANVGPSSPAELGSLGASLAKQGISVTTIGLGLGYNEDLMTQLAGRSDGNHAFVERYADLSTIFQREFGDILSVVAQNVEIKITCPEGVRPIRSLGREAEIHGQVVFSRLNQVYANQDKYLMLEVELPALTKGAALQVANVDVSFTDLRSKQRESLSRVIAVNFTDSAEAVQGSANKPTLEAYYTQLALETNDRAIALRDAGKIAEAESLLYSNKAFLLKNQDEYNLPGLGKQAESVEKQAKDLRSRDWGAARKDMYKQQQSGKMNQSW